MGDPNDKYCLRWNAFGSNLELSFQEFRAEQVFFDVTVACEDGQLGAHKAVLSAGSPFFRQILRQNPHTHPLLYIRGLRQAELGAVLDFMYLGEVSVRHTQLESFLSLAEELKVKGLVQGAGSNREESGAEEEEGSASSTSTSSGNRRKRRRRSKEHASACSKHVKTEEPAPHPPPPTSSATALHNIKTETSVASLEQPDLGEECGGGGDLEDSYDEQYLEGNLQFEEEYSQVLLDQADGSSGGMGETNLKADILVRSKMVESADGGWQCADCQFLGNINRVYKHIETNHVHVAYFCETCNKRCKTRNSLFCHRYRYHRTPRPLKPAAKGGGGGGGETTGGAAEHSDIVAQYAIQFRDTQKLDLRHKP